MKITIKIETTVVLDFRHPVMTEELARQMATSFETGWRLGAAKDLAVINHVYQQQFGHRAEASAKVAAHAEFARQAKKLLTLRTDAPVAPIKPSSCALRRRAVA